MEQTGDTTRFPDLERIGLRDAFINIARERILGGTPDNELIDEIVDEFVGIFAKENLSAILTEAPRRLRDERKRDIEEFYELYIELLFGESERYNDAYETHLLNDIKPPEGGVDEDTKRLFAVGLVNRLIFIKFLDIRDIIDENDFLLKRLRSYQQHQDELAGSVYQSQIKPLFDELLATPEDDRDPRYNSGWFDEIPYLNGGLFRDNVPNESGYGVKGGTLQLIIGDLIEGSEMGMSGDDIDPAIVGSVFEKIINHLDENLDNKDIGAYFTPEDVTNLITEQAVDPRIRDIIIEAYPPVVAANEEDERIIQRRLESKNLTEILQRVEDDEGWYNDPDAIEATLDEIANLKVVDPACGSGHFLTTAMDELHRAQLALMRGLQDDISDKERYEKKKELALNSIYGVDVQRVGVEIARFRIWLKMVDRTEWNDDFGKLPNIDVNIATGNSLIGLPVRGTVESADIWVDDLEQLVKKRREYKFEDTGSSSEIREFIDEVVQPQMNGSLLSQLNHTVETEVKDADKFEAIAETVEGPELYPTLDNIQVKREDRNALTEDDKEDLEEIGFNTFSKSARIQIQDREKELRTSGEDDVAETVLEELSELLDDRYDFTELSRQPTEYDLKRIQGRALHWVAEFPEVAETNGALHNLNFDIVLGNPPYGDILEEPEEMFVGSYDTAGCSEVAGNFVEREIQLLREDGWFGNITTLSMMYKGQMRSARDYLHRGLEDTRIASFGSRPSKVFDNADIKTCIITGRKADNSRDYQKIYTSDGIIFTDENRAEKFSNIEYGSAEGLYLGDKIGVDRDASTRIPPKVGGDTKRGILDKLKQFEGTKLVERYERDKTSSHDDNLWRREGMRYWVNPMYEPLYDSREVKAIYFETELERDFVFLLMNSSLYYVYWLSYGDFHHHNWTHIEAFPVPDMDDIRDKEEEITELADTLWDEMEDHFDPDAGLTGEFNMRPQKLLVNQVDEMLQNLYDLTDEEVEFLKNYLTDCGDDKGRIGPQNEDVTSYEYKSAEAVAED
jgi:type I restriction-modification system DNA methylase subunit